MLPWENTIVITVYVTLAHESADFKQPCAAYISPYIFNGYINNLPVTLLEYAV